MPAHVDSVPPAVHSLVRFSPRRILDIGPGWGSFGVLSREYLPDLECIEAIELAGALKPTVSGIYDEIFIGDVRDRGIDFWTDGPWDMVLLIDVLGYMPMADGHELLGRILGAGKRILVSTPIVWRVDYLSHWQVHDLAHGYPVAENVSTLDSLTVVLGKAV